METFLGFIAAFGFSFPPRGWSECTGQLLAIADNQPLFALLGNSYGGDGRTIFGLPDLRGRAPIGQGQGPGQPYYQIGALTGTRTQSLGVSQMPSHTHTAVVDGGAVDIYAALYVSTEDGQNVVAETGDYIGTSVKSRSDKNLTFVPEALRGDTVRIGGLQVAAGSATVINSKTGDSQPFSVMQPVLTLNFTIAMQGTFPSRN